MNSLDFFGQNDFSIFFNECHIDLGSIRFRKMLLLSECKTVSCIFMQYSAPKALRKGHKQNIGSTTYFQTHLLLQKYSNLTSFELQSDFHNPYTFQLQIRTKLSFTNWANILNICDNLCNCQSQVNIHASKDWKPTTQTD